MQFSVQFWMLHQSVNHVFVCPCFGIHASPFLRKAGCASSAIHLTSFKSKFWFYEGGIVAQTNLVWKVQAHFRKCDDCLDQASVLPACFSLNTLTHSHKFHGLYMAVEMSDLEAVAQFWASHLMIWWTQETHLK